MVVGLLAHRGRELAQSLIGGAQRRVLRHLALELQARGGVELAVVVGVERPVVALHVGFHLCSRSRGAAAVGASASASRRRARARRDITVPIGTPAMRAMSLYERSSSSRSTSAS